jgi:hypothetical protein
LRDVAAAMMPARARPRRRPAELAVTAGDPDVLAEVMLSVSSTFAWTGRLDRARALLKAFHAERKDFDEQAVQQALWRLGLVEFEAGRFARAADYAGRAREISLQYSKEQNARDGAERHGGES